MTLQTNARMNTLDLDPTRRLAARRSDTRWSDPDLFELINPMQRDSFVANVNMNPAKGNSANRTTAMASSFTFMTPFELILVVIPGSGY